MPSKHIPKASLGGGKTWIRLPEEAWPAHWHGKYTDPVCPLRLALYGHPDSGGFWERHCEQHLMAQGFAPVRPWRSCYYHKLLKQFLVVYVDDFKMSGPAETAQDAWNLIRTDSATTKGIEMDDPEPANRFLGCDHKVYEKEITWHGELPSILTPPPPKKKKKKASNPDDFEETWETDDDATPPAPPDPSTFRKRSHGDGVRHGRVVPPMCEGL